MDVLINELPGWLRILLVPLFWIGNWREKRIVNRELRKLAKQEA